MIARRARGKAALAPAKLRGVRMLMKALKERRCRRHPARPGAPRGEGVWAPFFGRRAYTMTLPARLRASSTRSSCSSTASACRSERGYRIHLRRLRSPTGDAAHDAAVMNRGLESLIRECPTQYLWGYNRYKVPAGAEQRLRRRRHERARPLRSAHPSAQRRGQSNERRAAPSARRRAASSVSECTDRQDMDRADQRDLPLDQAGRTRLGTCWATCCGGSWRRVAGSR